MAQIALVDSYVSGNMAVGAGGLGNYDSGTTTLLNSAVSDNSANFAAGILNLATLTLTGSTVSDNTAVQGGGGGIYNTATLTLLDSAVSGNMAFNDGGIFNSGTLALVESTVSGNTAILGNGGPQTSPDSSASAKAASSGLVAGTVSNYVPTGIVNTTAPMGQASDASITVEEGSGAPPLAASLANVADSRATIGACPPTRGLLPTDWL